MIEPIPINFSDILKGDTISRTWVLDGLKHSAEGVADHFQGDTWYNAEGAYIASQWGSGELKLVARPRKKLPTEPGAAIFVTVLNGSKLDEPQAMVADLDMEWWNWAEGAYYCESAFTEWVEAQIMPLETIVKED